MTTDIFTPCGYLSWTFNETEQRYQIYDRELLALIHALDEWKVYLEELETV
jgi:RNase H-like domain found in reverse transcriptase